MENVKSAHIIRHLDPSSLFRIEIQLHILTDVFKHIVLRYFSELISVQIHDGPGPMSPIVTMKTNSSHFRKAVLTSFQGFITYQTFSVSILDAFRKNTSFLDKSGLRWGSVDIKVGKLVKDCLKSPNEATLFRTTFGYCKAQNLLSHFTIHQLHFTGFDTMFSSKDYTESCHYGGLYIVFYPKFSSLCSGVLPRRYFRLCSNLTSNSTFPILSTEDELNILIIFQTFKGYSSGFVDITLHVEHDCYGKNFLISRISPYRKCSLSYQSFCEW